MSTTMTTLDHTVLFWDLVVTAAKRTGVDEVSVLIKTWNSSPDKHIQDVPAAR